MEINNLTEFTRYCQEHSDDPTLPETVELAERWTHLSSTLKRQYGGQVSEEEWIDEAFSRMPDIKNDATPEKLLPVHDVMTRFWIHGEAFDKWFRQKIVVITQEPLA